ncbi:MAG: hypothetical protein A3B74_02105 [Candidatus Kerfeldbacteria bacterium RIFCSPHIGHO2_02_FULL_42_14]|uniref:Tim44-like domain-containing protein n=1 Tax=Candidatus Kerfeldbacteria bacterium RIFCSPHIGHO2_02_FULL_42_14 TaxID=1798540 RepID=A0A1G2AR49_9BACT|nr:MAG: hypothetical protein A3B74_02105 [Candidatus Kerfeldbacteria bacterium RIFCSPHIGHO2_02_FULL_42_14]OGY81810.1 MAG: hypothetical protein A3E60_00680 [Candidatus Kerfeldbacteria bacterium RIFCSPHIGHO2_12_FULL_42_13]OGY84499.1 MAG: hypothetical protein A3I91_00295 [Candidatus Kerfeldbacteria bacterium RIFCSPLOWO2_02_FULL_42_19]OGY87606.1 MAG: hypothetical protein A3G01_02645 [Candidatus Kerfeldbacteria bacterium RIFCSPLOWO2_12_FULL_43_9]
MNKKFFIILIVFVTLLIIGGGILVWFLLKYQELNYVTNQPQNVNSRAVNIPVTTTNTQTANANVIEQNTNQEKSNLEQNTEDEITALSRSFIERFGTFSNQNEYENINNLRIYMTKKMQAYADTLIKNAKATDESSPYYGITTKVVSVEINELAPPQAQVKITTQRKETKENSETKVFYQDVEMGVVQEREVWKIDSVTWK